MENNYQEKILDVYHSFEAVKDCFAISRIQSEICALSSYTRFNECSRMEMVEKYYELDEILAKYSDVVEKTKSNIVIRRSCT